METILRNWLNLVVEIKQGLGVIWEHHSKGQARSAITSSLSEVRNKVNALETEMATALPAPSIDEQPVAEPAQVEEQPKGKKGRKNDGELS